MKGIRRTITVDPNLLGGINKFRAEYLLKNMEIDFTSAINLFAELGLTCWNSKDPKDVTIKRLELYFKYTGKGLGEAAMISTLIDKK